MNESSIIKVAFSDIRIFLFFRCFFTWVTLTLHCERCFSHSDNRRRCMRFFTHEKILLFVGFVVIVVCYDSYHSKRWLLIDFVFVLDSFSLVSLVCSRNLRSLSLSCFHELLVLYYYFLLSTFDSFNLLTCLFKRQNLFILNSLSIFLIYFF